MGVFTLMISAALAAQAPQPQVSLQSHIAVERVSIDKDGTKRVSFEEPKVVTPGDRLAFTLAYANASNRPAENFVITDPMPKGVVFADHESPGALVSVDGGKSFGLLSALKAIGSDGSLRPANASDVTHVQWRFSRPIAPGEHGQVKFEGVVR